MPLRPNDLLDKVAPLVPLENAIAPRPTWADAAQYNATAYGDFVERQNALPPQSWADIAGMYANGLLMGSTAPGMRGVRSDNPAFTKWFGKSAIVDEAGKPAVVYHGTRAERPVSNFDQQAAEATGRWSQDAGADVGFHFSPEEETAAIYGKVGGYHLKMEKPLRIKERDVSAAQEKWLSDLENSGSSEHADLADYIRATKAFDNPGSGYYNYGLGLLTKEAKANGYDGAIFTRQRDFADDSLIDEYIAFHPENIRSASGAKD